MTVLRWQTHLGFAKESGGWGVAFTTPNTWVPVDGGAKFTDNLKYYYDEAFRSVQAKDFGAFGTTATGDFSFKTDVYVDTIPTLVGAGIIGNNDVVATVNLSALNTGWTTGSTSAHSFIIQPNGPSSLTLFDYNGYTERAYQGARMSEVSLKYSPDGSLTADFKGQSRASIISASAGNVATAAIGTHVPILGWQAVLTLGGSQSFRMIDCDLTLKRAVEVLYTQAGTQSPTNIFAFPLEVDGKLTFDFVDETEFAYFRNSTQGVTFDLLFVSTSTDALRFTVPNPIFTTAEVDRGKDALTVQLDFRGVYAQTASTNVKMVVYNNVTTPY